MNHNTQINTRIKLENIVILFIVLASLALLILSFSALPAGLGGCTRFP